MEFIRNGIVMEVIGKEGLPFLPFLTSIFVFVWVNNLYGIIPGIQFPTTARMAIPRSSPSSCGSSSTSSASSSRVGCAT